MPKLLGIYEKELVPMVLSFTSLNFTHLIDIGSAKGYYAVGLAKLLNIPIIAFEMEEKGRLLSKLMTGKNDVEKYLDIRGKCEIENLVEVLKITPKPLIICDVEGYEDILLNLEKIPGLRKAYILVEIHEFVVPGVEKRIIQRF